LYRWHQSGGRSRAGKFPSTGEPLAGCQAGTIIYVFTPGEVTVCPYLVFAARTPQSQHDPAEFIVGNIFADRDIAARLDAYNFGRRYPMGGNPTCGSCGLASDCGKGCPLRLSPPGSASALSTPRCARSPQRSGGCCR
jgi:radical SAM protein with 4Fe4S-binding SPASM domain